MKYVGTPPIPGKGYGRDFRVYVIGQAVSIMGDRIATIALVFLIIELSRSYAPALAVFYVCRVLPTLLGGLLTGLIVDHVDRRRLMIGCDIGRAVVLALTPVISSVTLWTLYPIVIVLFACTLLFDTAARAALPDVVPESQLMGANALLHGVDTAADCAYVIGGGLVLVLNLRAPFYIDSATFLFSAAMINGMKIPARALPVRVTRRNMLSLIRQGIDHLLDKPFLRRSTMVMLIAPLAGGASFVITPFYASTVLAQSGGLIGPFRSGPFRFSMLEVGLGLGALIGSIAVSRLQRLWPRGRIFCAGLTGLGVTEALLAGTTNLYLALAIVLVSGLFNILFVISATTILQTLTPSALRGRVLAARATVTNLSLAVGSLAGGGLLLWTSAGKAWLLLAAVTLGSTVPLWLDADVREQP